MRLYVALVHYPVYNKNREIIASAITTVDLHDIARAAKTYGAKRFFVITPLKDQQALAGHVIRHWTKGYGASYNKDRKEAIQLVAVLPSVEETIHAIEADEGRRPLLFATDARDQILGSTTYAQARAIMEAEAPCLLMFGTAWGLDQELIKAADHILAPISGGTGYRHLSVRAAAAVVLDRLAGARL